jgi:secreted trypsin-like serine protease
LVTTTTPPYLAGVVSYGYSNCVPPTNGVYTNISYYLSWIGGANATTSTDEPSSTVQNYFSFFTFLISLILTL